MELPILRIKVTMPNAHFRVVHSSNPRKTYSVPPYSTVIGFLANILGSDEKIQEMITGSLALGILSSYEYVGKEYIWMRNLNRNSHIQYYGSVHNRERQGIAEHPGGQIPINIEVLNNVDLYLYVYHSDKRILDVLQQNIFNPENWFSHLHLGRSEDWAMIESVEMISLITSNKAAEMFNSGNYYQWMPKCEFSFGIGSYIDQGEYEELYEKVQNSVVLVTSVYKLVEVSYGMGQKAIIRNFRHIPARLTRNPIPFLDTWKLPTVFADLEIKAPVYLANINSAI